MIPTIGRIVHYKLSANDALRINRNWLEHGGTTGNASSEGDVVPLIIVRVWPDEFGAGIAGVNGQAILDGHDTLWVTSAKEGTEAGQWCWPPRVGGAS